MRRVVLFVLPLLLAPGLARAQRELTPEKEKQILQRHPEADTDKDGKLSQSELRAAMQARAGKGTPTDGKPADGTAPAAGKAAKAARLSQREGKGPTPDFADVSYGPYPSNKLDLWLAKSDKPTPLVVFIHGGGFVGGDKSSATPTAIERYLKEGVSFASINYRFRTEVPINTVLRDSARAIQFLRYKAGEYNIDKTRVAAFGGSAGAGTSVWLAVRDDLADPKSDDPVLQESTRLVAAGSSAGQVSYDILKWRDVLGSDEAMRFYPESDWPKFYGLQTLEEVKGPEGAKLRADVDMIGLITKDDPPMWLGAGEGHEALANKGDTNHTPLHSEALKKRCDEVGVPCVLQVGEMRRDGNAGQIEFLLKYLKGN